jgi:hypothetical protein
MIAPAGKGGVLGGVHVRDRPLPPSLRRSGGAADPLTFPWAAALSCVAWSRVGGAGVRRLGAIDGTLELTESVSGAVVQVWDRPFQVTWFSVPDVLLPLIKDRDVPAVAALAGGTGRPVPRARVGSTEPGRTTDALRAARLAAGRRCRSGCPRQAAVCRSSDRLANSRRQPRLGVPSSTRAG